MGRFIVDVKGVEDIVKLLDMIPVTTERTIEQYLREHGVELIKSSVKGFIHPSGRDKSSYRTGPSISSTVGKPFTEQYVPAGVDIYTKGGAANSGKNSWGYLVFPDEGRGNKNKVAQDFTNKGTNKAEPDVYAGLLDAIEVMLTKL